MKQDGKRALELASVCDHPDARWLTEAFAGKDVRTEEEASAIFVALGEDTRALCFAARLGFDEVRMRRSAEMGYAFAQAIMAGWTDGEDESFKWAKQAALQGERDGFYMLGHCFERGVGCEKDLDKAKENYLRAADLGHVSAMERAADLMETGSPKRWKLLGRAFSLGSSNSLMSVLNIISSPRWVSCLGFSTMFMIGRCLNGHIDTEKITIFGDPYFSQQRLVAAVRAVELFKSQCHAARAALDTWTLIARRSNKFINRDVRKLVSLKLWKARKTGLWE